MKLMHCAILTFAAVQIAVSGSAASATATDNIHTPITIGYSAVMRSAILQEERRVMTYLPPDYESGKRRYPVLYLLDGDSKFHYATGIVGFLIKNDRIPAMIVIGIPNTKRTRDLTAAEQISEEDKKAGTVGQAANFLRFLTDELVPWVGSHYRTEPFRILVGHSRGGSFNLYTLMKRPDVFPVHIAISPALWRNKQALVPLAAEALVKLPPSRFHFLSLSWGDESFYGLRSLTGLGPAHVPTASRTLVSLLQRTPAPNLEFHSHFYPEDDHISTPHRSLYDGLEKLFPDWRPNEIMQAGDLAGVEKHYQRLSAKYGFTAKPPVSVLVYTGRALIDQGKSEQALAVFQHAVQVYPDQPEGHAYVGEAQELLGRPKEARDAYARAIAITDKDAETNDEYYRSVRARVRRLSTPTNP